MRNVSRIAVGADEQGALWEEHFGISPFYHLYDTAGVLMEKRPNPHASGGHHGNPTLIVELLEECGVWIARTVGRKQEAEERGIRVIITQATTVDDAVSEYLRSQS